MTFQNGADLEPTLRQPLFSILAHGTAQAAYEQIEQPTTQLGSVSFVDAVTREVKASICQQIKLSAAYLKGGGGGVNTGILNSEFGHAFLMFGGIKLTTIITKM